MDCYFRLLHTGCAIERCSEPNTTTQVLQHADRHNLACGTLQSAVAVAAVAGLQITIPQLLCIAAQVRPTVNPSATLIAAATAAAAAATAALLQFAISATAGIVKSSQTLYLTIT
jgi:hypothetical protein